MLDLLIIGFACLSLTAFVITKDKQDKKENVQVQRETDTGS
jgi:hypothetical protein